MLPEGVECFAGDLSEQDQKVVWATHYPPAADPGRRFRFGSIGLFTLVSRYY